MRLCRELNFQFLIPVILFLWRKTKTARTDILLLGPSDSGKTYLFSQLLFSEDKETFTSISANTGIYYNGAQVSIIEPYISNWKRMLYRDETT